jgi:hypothetical protein
MQTKNTLRAPFESPEPGIGLRIGAVALPILKCAVCPACLGVLGSLFAGARIGLMGDERFHGALILVALIADLIILRASVRHHARGGPLWLCVVGASCAIAGHLSWEPVEYAGFLLLLASGLWNLALLRAHRRAGGSCCAHDRHDLAMR